MAKSLLSRLRKYLKEKSGFTSSEIFKDKGFIEQLGGEAAAKHLESPMNNYYLTLLVFTDMAKDFVDTFKPYKYEWHLWRDLMQLSSGLINLGKGLAGIVKGVLYFLKNTFYTLPSLAISCGPKVGLRVAGSILSFAIAKLLHSFVLALRGLSQFVSGLFLSVPRVALRSVITACTGWKKFQFENEPGIKAGILELSDKVAKNEIGAGFNVLYITTKLGIKLKKNYEHNKEAWIQDGKSVQQYDDLRDRLAKIRTDASIDFKFHEQACKQDKLSVHKPVIEFQVSKLRSKLR